MIRFILTNLSEKLGCEVVEISALKRNMELKNLANKAVKLAESKKENKIVHKFANEKVETSH